MENPATADAPAGTEPAWRFLVQPKWLAWHATMVLAFCGMLWLGDWQFSRAMGGNGLSWAYTFEWPLFAAFSVVFWAKTIRDEIRIRTGKIPDPKVINALLEAAAEARALAVIDPSRPRAITAGSTAGDSVPGVLGKAQADGFDFEFDDDEPEDEELARYNARLARLAMEDRAKAARRAQRGGTSR